MNFTKSIESNINKLVGTLKSEEQLEEVLKKKFTKKELKVFVAKETNMDIEDIKNLVHDDEKRIEELYKSACKKLNQEKIKQELVNL
jgi:adenylosuccinate lyase